MMSYPFVWITMKKAKTEVWEMMIFICMIRKFILIFLSFLKIVLCHHSSAGRAAVL